MLAYQTFLCQLPLRRFVKITRRVNKNLPWKSFSKTKPSKSTLNFRSLWVDIYTILIQNFFETKKGVRIVQIWILRRIEIRLSLGYQNVKSDSNRRFLWGDIYTILKQNFFETKKGVRIVHIWILLMREIRLSLEYQKVKSDSNRRFLYWRHTYIQIGHYNPSVRIIGN